MENTTHASRLRYLDADDVDDSLIDYDGLDVRGADGQKLGHVDGFIVDHDAARVYYVVVDSGGWFSSQRFLLPVGHARLDTDARALEVDVTRDALAGYPEFDHERFRSFSDADLREYERRMGDVCCPSDTIAADASTWAYDTRRHYAQPDWWPRNMSYERVGPVDTRTTRAEPVPVRDTYNEDRVTARDASSGREAERAAAREAGDVSPHPGGRAQPGDVLGLETGGERTGIGDTDADEDKRRRDAERAASKLDRDR